MAGWSLVDYGDMYKMGQDLGNAMMGVPAMERETTRLNNLFRQSMIDENKRRIDQQARMDRALSRIPTTTVETTETVAPYPTGYELPAPGLITSTTERPLTMKEIYKSGMDALMKEGLGTHALAWGKEADALRKADMADFRATMQIAEKMGKYDPDAATRLVNSHPWAKENNFSLTLGPRNAQGGAPIIIDYNGKQIFGGLDVVLGDGTHKHLSPNDLKGPKESIQDLMVDAYKRGDTGEVRRLYSLTHAPEKPESPFKASNDEALLRNRIESEVGSQLNREEGKTVFNMFTGEFQVQSGSTDYQRVKRRYDQLKRGREKYYGLKHIEEGEPAPSQGNPFIGVKTRDEAITVAKRLKAEGKTREEVARMLKEANLPWQ